MGQASQHYKTRNKEWCKNCQVYANPLWHMCSQNQGKGLLNLQGRQPSGGLALAEMHQHPGTDIGAYAQQRTY